MAAKRENDERIRQYKRRMQEDAETRLAVRKSMIDYIYNKIVSYK
jgi:hypothetical protein